MSETLKFRNKILASFLTVMMVVAIGAELHNHSQSTTGFKTQNSVDIELAAVSKTISRKKSFRDQLTVINSTDLVASRFYAPLHAPFTWIR